MSGEEPAPSWIDPENDESLKAEIEPLFGTGKIALEDDDLEEANVIQQRRAYGAINDSDEEDPKIEETVITTASSASSKSGKASRGKSKPRVNKIVVTESGKPEMPRPNCLMGIFKFIETVGVVGSLALMTSQVIPLIVIPWDEIGLASLCLKIYVSLFCILFLLVEVDAPVSFLRNAAFLQTYFSRGFLYSFIGLSALEEAYSERVDDMIAHQKDQFHVSWLSLFMQVSSWVMLVLGCIYMLFGLCCLKVLRDKLYRNHKEKWQIYREALKSYNQMNP